MNTLEEAIGAQRRELRGYEAAGQAYQADLAAARLWGLIRARELLFGDPTRPPACAHTVHDRIGSKSFCRQCGDEYPHEKAGG